MIKTLCMALECTNEVTRHPYNFGSGFCPSCEAVKNQIFINYLIEEIMGDQLTPDQVYNIMKTWPPAEQRAFLQELERQLSAHHADDIAHCEEKLNEAHKRAQIFENPVPAGARPIHEGTISQKLG